MDPAEICICGHRRDMHATNDTTPPTHWFGCYKVFTEHPVRVCPCISFKTQSESDKQLAKRLNEWEGTKKRRVETAGVLSETGVVKPLLEPSGHAPAATSEHWKPPLPKSLEPIATGHTKECEDSDSNVCICGKLPVKPKTGLDQWT